MYMKVDVRKRKSHLIWRELFLNYFFFELNLSLGVSIGLDMVSIEISISTPKKSQSRPSRKSRRFSKVSLDTKDVLFPDLDWSRRPKVSIFVKVSIEISISTPKKVNLDGFQKLVSTRRTFSISISIGLDVETTRLN